MFCSNCGNKYSETAIFCGLCGKQRPENFVTQNTLHAQTAGAQGSVGVSPTSMLSNKKVFAIIAGVIAVVLLIVFITNRDDSGLRGTWAMQHYRGDHAPTVQFSGNSFTFTNYSEQHTVRLPGGGIIWDPVSFSTFWMSGSIPDYSARSIIQAGSGLNNQGWFAVPEVARYTHRGTYSIAGDILELVFSDGTIRTYNFSRTDNTLDIRGNRFIRR